MCKRYMHATEVISFFYALLAMPWQVDGLGVLTVLWRGKSDTTDNVSALGW